MKARALPALIAALLLPVTQAHGEGLMDVYRKALSYDSELAAARAARQAREAAVAESRAPLLPQLDAFGESTYTELNTVDGHVTNHEYGLQLSQPLFRANAWYGFQASQKQSKVAAAELSRAEQGLMLKVAEQYFNVLRAKDELDTAQAQEAALRRQWEQAKERYDVGLVATTEVEEARAGYDASRSQRIAAQSQLDIERESLARLTGQFPETLERLETDFPISSPEPANPKAWAQTALEQNWELKAQQLTVDATREQLSAARSEHLPTLDLFARVQRQHQDNDFDLPATGAPGAPIPTNPMDEYPRTDTTIGLSLNIPLYSGGGTQAGVRRVRAESEQAQRNLDTVRRNVRLDARSLFRRITTNIQTINAQRQTIVSRRSALDATRAGYEVGTRNIVEVLDAEQNYYVALRDYANARYDYVLNTLRLKQVAGTLSPQDLQGLDRWLSATAPGIERLARQVTREERQDNGDQTPDQ
ncbi:MULTISPECIES: TolC family outer membrane protein [Halomonadaceae]|uniref:TolC family outer membrane protein n=1 Tax=Vreelandella halophila TaxID=86177 RepID=A0A9X4YEA4_9GAMM|nr:MULTISPECIES: TolC family outer membrane protein [Halomonas]MYL27648.1 TolC family outer membrane protein [Halomonas utahensis]MYL75378.1 TolC family outer membrane protein [Halomonas sp. 22501_18_FS]